MPRARHHCSPAVPRRTVVAMTASPDLYDAALSALRNHVDGLGVSLAV